MGDGITYGNQLEEVGKQILGNKFFGVFQKGDLLPVLKERTGLIINNPTNEHWIAMYRLNDKIHTFDSFGRKYIKGESIGPNPVMLPDNIKQRKNQFDCGERSLAYLYIALR